ncbi:hypothetical protein BCR39DRAFT_539973 [Naematelia encephala]|uniref:NADH:flavin oxidoreductase/NADH oxidase N-terminal domain-containing protein n=1 Tax=Naematelia encephala TaxID=71784 RepID=A0A1Y2AX65_9TREE|nr:hypothetical protein BCR39DRAFT_539973 [Naematelia encephala]
MPVADLSTLPPQERAEKSLLFKPFQLGGMGRLEHRIALAPLTRNRGRPSDKHEGTWVPWDIQTKYYTQRATKGGLLISEALPISLQARAGSMFNVPGIFTDEQKEGWKSVVEAVKPTGAVFVAQLFHGGRSGGHTALSRAVSSSATRIESSLMGGPGDVPDEMTLEDIKRTIGDYVQCAKNAIEAGFDGIEIHGGNGYLPDQFLHSNVNKRTDAYGGSIGNRNRFVIELCEAVASAIGPDKFGLRLAPYGFFNETRGTQRTEQWSELCRALAPKGYAYIHFMEARYDEVLSEQTKLSALGQEMSTDFSSDGLPTLEPFRAILGKDTPMIVAGGYDTENCWEVVDSGRADIIAFGRFFTSNPDLVWRIQNGKELVKYIRPLFYVWPEGKPAQGYVDFANHEENVHTQEEKLVLEEHKKRGIVVAKPGWQLSQDGVQLGEIFV